MDKPIKVVVYASHPDVIIDRLKKKIRRITYQTDMVSVSFMGRQISRDGEEITLSVKGEANIQLANKFIAYGAGYRLIEEANLTEAQYACLMEAVEKQREDYRKYSFVLNKPEEIDTPQETQSINQSTNEEIKMENINNNETEEKVQAAQAEQTSTITDEDIEKVKAAAEETLKHANNFKEAAEVFNAGKAEPKKGLPTLAKVGLGALAIGGLFLVGRYVLETVIGDDSEVI